MATENKPTPEEQLLRLIEGSSAEDTLITAQSVEAPNRDVVQAGTIIARAKRFFPGMGQNGFNVKTLNRLLVIATLVLAGYLTWEFTARQAIYGNDVKPVSVSTGTRNDIPVKEGYIYEEIVGARNAFKPVPEEKPVIVTPPPPVTNTDPSIVVPPPPPTKLDEIILTLKLRGISWEPAPPTVIIEDENISDTHVLSAGELLKTKVTKDGRTMEVQIKIKTISRDKVVLSYGDDEKELILSE
jgi:hypothetical protein